MLTSWFNKIKKLFRKLSLIYIIKYIIYIKFKHIGRFLNNTNFNQLITLILLILMFLIDNLILYNNLYHIFYLYGISFNFLIYLEFKGFIIFLFNIIYSLLVSYLLKNISYRCWINSDFCYTLISKDKNSVKLCYVLFPFQMFSGPESVYHQSISIISGYWGYYYPESHKQYWIDGIDSIIWIIELVFIWPHLYFVKLIYNIIKINSSIIHDYNYFHGHPIFKKYFCKLIYVTNFVTWYLIIFEIFILNLILQIHFYLPLLLYIVCKFRIFKKYFLRYYRLHTLQNLIKKLDFFELQKYLWDDYRGIGFFINNGKIYINGLEETKYNNIKWGFHQFTPNNFNRHFAYKHNLITGLTTTPKYKNLLLPTQNLILYAINKYSLTNEQYFYNIPDNLGTFLTNCEKSDWITRYSFEWQVLVIQDFWQVTKPENGSIDVIEWKKEILTQEHLKNISDLILDNNLEFEDDLFN